MIELLIILVVLGVCAYLVDKYVPMDPPFKVVFRVIIVLVLVILILNAFGITNIRLPD